MLANCVARLALSTLLVASAVFASGPVMAQETGGGQQADETGWRDASRCSVNAVYIGLKLLGRRVDYASVLERVPIGEKGARLTDMRDCAASFGVEAQVVKATPASLAACPLPAIAHCEEEHQTTGHYVVVVGLTPDEVEYIDGTTGNSTTAPMAEFSKRWTGHLLLLQAPPRWRPLFWTAVGLGAAITALASVLKVKGYFRGARRSTAASGNGAA
jgi:hypothetical protein